MTVRREAIVGALLGTAIGDSVGLAYEGLSRRRARRIFGAEVRNRLLFGHGMVSDDTEHSCLVMQALIASGDDPDVFSRRLARGLRLWLLGLPAGAGLATIRATLKLCVGVSPTRSGVFSAGNGPAMRAAVLGAAIDDTELLREFVNRSTRITHTDPKAEQGALAVALAAHLSARGSDIEPISFQNALREVLNPREADEFLTLIERAFESVLQHQSTQTFADALGLSHGVSGYMFHTVPVVLHSWLTHQNDYKTAVSEILLCGGDTDSTAAMVGGIIGAAVGKSGIPTDWLAQLWEWPRTVNWMERLADQLYNARTSRKPAVPLRLPAYGVLPRNLLFAPIVLTHGFRRLLPPY